MFIESIRCTNLQVLTPYGYQNVEYIHKTKPLLKYRLILDNGMTVECAECHVLIDKDYNEIYACNCQGKYLITETGISKVVECINLHIYENMYDLSLDTSKINNELYFSNGVLSHNSGKSITTAIYLCWLFLFSKDINIGIAANRGSMAREFLNNVKNIFVLLPIWLQQGIKIWNMGSILSENNVRILTDSCSGDSYRGFTCLSSQSEVSLTKSSSTLDHK